jgi:hypothetical protein
MATTVTERFKSGPRVAELWLGILLGPVAALSQLEANYALVGWACAYGRSWPLHLVALAALVIALLAGFLAYRNLRRLGARWQEDGQGVFPRSRFMAALGVLISLLMLLVIIAQWIPVFIYGPCQRFV